jgi:hypothetical protein
MKYLIYGNEQDAKNRSEQIANEQGCSGNLTKYWFGWITSYSNPPATAMIVPDDQTDLLNHSEQSLLQTNAQLEAMGWFPPQILPIP